MTHISGKSLLETVKEELGFLPEKDYRIEKERIKWDHIFLIEALLWSYRSHDAQTQCGCVLVGEDNTVLSTGYNGFMRDIDDSVLPNVRPLKYPFMIHAEHNAILNCASSGRSTLGSTAYITDAPCNWCLQYLWQAGIKKIVYSNMSNVVMTQNEDEQRIHQVLLRLMNPSCLSIYCRMEVQFIPSTQIDFSPIVDMHYKFCGNIK